MKEPTRRNLPRIFTALVVSLWLQTDAHTAGTLHVELSPLTLRPRSHAPESVDAKFGATGRALFEGILEIVPNDSRFIYRTQELALLPDGPPIRLLLPSFPWEPDASRAARLRLLGKMQTVDLGEQPLGGATFTGRTFTICVSKGASGAATDGMPLWRSLRLERFEPSAKSATLEQVEAGRGAAGRPRTRWTPPHAVAVYSPPIATWPIFIPPEELPATPLGYCVYDVVILEREGFSLLREKQLNALAQWVRSGGSLMLVAPGSLEVKQAAFLNALTDQTAGPHFIPHEELQLVRGEQLISLRPGLGRVVIATSVPSPEELETADWRRAGAFLWKVRAAQAENIAGPGVWQFNQSFNQVGYSNGFSLLQRALLPHHVQLVPWSLLAIILGSFIILVGPIDYLILGKLRRRYLTWILFPVVCLAVTVFTIRLSNSFLGSNDFRGSLIINDIASDNRVVRQNRFELIFPAHEQEVATSIHNALCCPYLRGMPFDWRDRRHDMPLYEGQFPAHYVVKQRLAQWSFEINRVTSLEPSADVSGIDWNAFDWANSKSLLPGETLAKRMGVGGALEVCLLHDTTTEHPLGKSSSNLAERDWSSLAEFFSRRRGGGIFSVISCVAPNGGSALDDLWLVDPDDRARAVLVVLERKGDNLIMHRRLYSR